MSSYKRKFFVNTISNIMFRLLIMVFGIVLVPLIITNVGEEEYGLLLLTNNLMGYFLLLNAGMPTGVTKFVSEFMAKDEKMKAFEVINASMLFFMFIGLLSATGIVIFINVGGINIFEITEANVSTAVTLFYIAGFWSIISWPMNNIFEGIYKGLQQFTKFNVINGIGSTLVLFTTLFLAYRKESIVMILLGQNLGQLLKWIALFYFFKKSFPDFKFSFNRDIFSVLYISQSKI